MNDGDDIVTASHEHPGALNKSSYASLYRRFMFLALICSALPLLLVGWVIYLNYSKFASSRMVDSFQRRVEYNRRIVELFLKERASDLQLLALTHSLAELGEPSNLERIFAVLKREDSYFEDLGFINESGMHVAYVGPYDLMDKDYSVTFWFKGLMGSTVYISDMFMGYRKTPHFIIAIRWLDGGKNWILRATVETEFLSSLIGGIKLGESGEVYLLNGEGLYQTNPRFGGKIMDRSPLPVATFSGESGVRILDAKEIAVDQAYPSQVVGYAWLKEPHWVLVVKQDYAEAFQDVNHANTLTLVFLHLSILAILVVAFITTKHMIKVIRKRDEEAEHLNRQLMQASKLASLGELAAGVAHEINNPLAIILTESQIVRDFTGDYPDLNSEFKAELAESLTQVDKQVHRCNDITYNLLRFARRSHAVTEWVDLNACLQEMIGLLEKRGKTKGVEFVTDLQGDLPRVLTDGSQLQQVFVNLAANAIDAHDGKPCGTIRVSTCTSETNQGVEISMADTGSGMPPEVLEKIFDPFFTTKPVGKGTGLGLSISYNIVKELDGVITVHSEVGKGTEFKIILPLRSSGHHHENEERIHGGNCDETGEDLAG
jgi:two-component system, NtrC family, sensor kinase